MNTKLYFLYIFLIFKEYYKYLVGNLVWSLHEKDIRQYISNRSFLQSQAKAEHCTIVMPVTFICYITVNSEGQLRVRMLNYLSCCAKLIPLTAFIEMNLLHWLSIQFINLYYLNNLEDGSYYPGALQLWNTTDWCI